MKIYITPLERIIVLQRENARLRALVGEAPAPDPLEVTDPGAESAEAAQQATLVQITEELGQAVTKISEVVL